MLQLLAQGPVISSSPVTRSGTNEALSNTNDIPLV